MESPGGLTLDGDCGADELQRRRHHCTHTADIANIFLMYRRSIHFAEVVALSLLVAPLVKNIAYGSS
jgi:hypothetical protein